MIHIGICDDIKFFADDLKNKIIFAKASDGVEIDIHTYCTAKEILDAMNDIDFNIVFLDIFLENEKMTGLSVGDRIKEKLTDCLIIYVSSYDYFYKDMVNHELFRFLPKPVDNKRLEEALSLAYFRLRIGNEYYSFTYNRVLKIVRIKDIKYVYSQHRKIFIVMNDNSSYPLYKKLDDFEKEINSKYNYFIRIAKSYLVNLLQAKFVHRDYIEYSGGERLYYSKKYAKEAIEKICNLK